jgi:hypothetical protein
MATTMNTELPLSIRCALHRTMATALQAGPILRSFIDPVRGGAEKTIICPFFGDLEGDYDPLRGDGEPIPTFPGHPLHVKMPIRHGTSMLHNYRNGIPIWVIQARSLMALMATGEGTAIATGMLHPIQGCASLDLYAEEDGRWLERRCLTMPNQQLEPHLRADRFGGLSDELISQDADLGQAHRRIPSWKTELALAPRIDAP